MHRIPAAAPTGGSLLSKALAALVLARGTLAARRLDRGRLRPLCVVGFGGYPTVPPVLAATQFGVPTILHEQNAVMGRANRFLARRVDSIATGFPSPRASVQTLQAKTIHTGNPVRLAVIEAARIALSGFRRR